MANDGPLHHTPCLIGEPHPNTQEELPIVNNPRGYIAAAQARFAMRPATRGKPATPVTPIAMF